MEKLSIAKFQHEVDDVLIRHRSVLDLLTKLQESSARVNRAVAKSATDCGCIELHVKKQELPAGISYSQLKNHMSNHVEGNVCNVCKEKIEQEISTNFFYIAALCNLLDINLEELLNNYHNNQLKTLGKYSLL